ncbi:hypothetical protein CD934_09740 [Streptomyces calvus]|uniref:Uncharacterized protein n=1 Tax=Streptomyces calvus TaxID=67282 RepID=A0A514JNM4_9ACTN|nr:hypothetical protein CD934_09740 [Streptomyces calvus]
MGRRRLGSVVWISAAVRCGVLSTGPSGVRCVQLQGGGGRQRGALATDDNAADARAGPRDPGMIQTTDPSRGPRSGSPREPRGDPDGRPQPRKSGARVGEASARALVTSSVPARRP